MPTAPQSMRQYSFFTLFVTAIAFGVILFWPFFKVLIISVALAVIFSPINQWFLRHVTRGNKWFAALFTVLLFIIIVCGPLALIALSVVDQAQALYTSVSHGGATTVVGWINNTVNHYLPGPSIDVGHDTSLVASYFTPHLGDILGSVLSATVSLFLIILAMFYFLEDGVRWHRSVVQGSPISDESAERILDKLSLAIHGVVKGYLLVAILQGAMLGIGLWLFGVPNAAVWGVFAGVASLVPTIGTSLVSVPAVIFLAGTGHTGAAIGLGIWAAVLVGLLDNFLTPVVVGRKIDIHPMFILFSVLGGIALMGPAGILIGPLIISFIYALTTVYSSEMKKETTVA